MLRYPRTVDEVHTIVLEPRVTRAFWSARRAQHGAKLSLHVETKYVPDHTPIDLEIWEDDSKEGSADDFIEALPPQTKLERGRLVLEHEIDWSAEALGRDLDLEGDDYEFYFKVKIPRFGVEARSTLLFVDLHPFQFSR